jgi:predicted small integral membrane protein
MMNDTYKSLMSYPSQCASAYHVIILQTVLKVLCYIRGVACSNPLLKGRSSNLVILKARTEKHICKLMGKLKFPEDLSIGGRWFPNDIPSMLGFQPDPPKSS